MKFSYEVVIDASVVERLKATGKFLIIMFKLNWYLKFKLVVRGDLKI